MEMCIKAVKNSGDLPSHRHVDPGWRDSHRLVTTTTATEGGISRRRCIRASAPVYNYWRWKCFMMRCWICETEREERRCFRLDFLPDRTQTTDAYIRHNKQTKLLINHKTVTHSVSQSGSFKEKDLSSCRFPSSSFFVYDQDV